MILQNQDCNARFIYDAAALKGSTNHQRRTVPGLATGDLNGDRYVDIISVSNADYPEPIPLARYAAQYGSPFDALAVFVPTFRPVAQGAFRWSGIEEKEGTLSVELNSGGNGNGWVAVSFRGSVGTVAGGRAPRDGIGSVAFFTPEGGKSVMRPVLGGLRLPGQPGRHFRPRCRDTGHGGDTVAGRDAQSTVRRAPLRAGHVSGNPVQLCGCVASRRGVSRLCRPRAGRVGAQGGAQRGRWDALSGQRPACFRGARRFPIAALGIAFGQGSRSRS